MEQDYIQLNWPDVDPVGLALLQDVAQEAAVIFNGLYSLSDGTVNLIQNGFARQITIISTNDDSDAIFTVIGTQNGVTIMEDITGLDKAVASSVNYYDTVTSIVTDTAVQDITVGIGLSGYFAPVPTYISSDKILTYNINFSCINGCNLNLSFSQSVKVFMPNQLIFNANGVIQSPYVLTATGSPCVGTSELQFYSITANMIVQVSQIAVGSSATLEFKRI